MRRAAVRATHQLSLALERGAEGAVQVPPAPLSASDPAATWGGSHGLAGGWYLGSPGSSLLPLGRSLLAPQVWIIWSRVLLAALGRGQKWQQVKGMG